MRNLLTRGKQIMERRRENVVDCGVIGHDVKNNDQLRVSSQVITEHG